MKFYLFLLLVILSCPGLNAQDYSRDFGVVCQEEFALKEYDKDPEAEAVVLYDIGKSWFIREEGGFDLMFERATRIKILSEAGLDYAEVEIPLYHESNLWETVRDIEAYTYNEVNGIYEPTRLEKAGTYTETINDNWSVTKFVLPNVKPGSIIEYRYKKKSPYIFNLTDWEFQRSIPTVFSEYTVKLTPFYSYTFILQGASRFDHHESYVDNGIPRQFGSVSYQDMVHVYGMRDVPAFKSEEFITSKEDYIIKIDFQLSRIVYTNGSDREIMTSWAKMTDDYYSRDGFGKYLKKSAKYYPDFINGLSIASRSDSAKIESIVSAVKANFKWNGYYRKVAESSLKNFLKEKTGSSAEINLFLTGLLQAAGYEAYPVLISTRGHGRVWKEYPFSHFFNYVISMVKIDGAYLLLDACSLASADLQLPPRCFNEYGLVMIKGKPEWVPVRADILSMMEHHIDIRVADYDMTASVKVSGEDFRAYDLRMKYGNDKEKLEEELQDIYDEGTISSVIIEDDRDANKPYSYTYTLEAPVEVINGKIFISPFLKESVKDNPFKQSKRNYPIDFIYPRHLSYQVAISIPEGYRIEHFPEDKKILTNEFLLEYSTIQKENVLSVDFQYAFPSSIYDEKDYRKIKFYYNELISLATDKIVLVKEE